MKTIVELTADLGAANAKLDAAIGATLSATAKHVLLSLAQQTKPIDASDYHRAPAYECAAAGLANVIDGWIGITPRGLEVAATLGGKA